MPLGVSGLNAVEDFAISDGGNRIALVTNDTTEIWTRNRETEVFELTYQYITPEYDGFGVRYGIRSVAISGNGRVAALAYTYHPADGGGGVIKFCVQGGEWDRCGEARSIPDGYYADRFGADVTLSDDGSVMAVGATNDISQSLGVDAEPFDHRTWYNNLPIDGINYDERDYFEVWFYPPNEMLQELPTGAVYVFGPGEQETFIKPPGVAENLDSTLSFGGSIVLSGDGKTLAVGVPDQNFGNGQIYLLRESGGQWVYDETFWAESDCYMDGGGCGYIGGSLDLTRDGNTLITGCNGCDPFVPEQYYDGPLYQETVDSREAWDFGSPLIWRRINGTWEPLEPDLDRFGRAQVLPPVSYFEETIQQCLAGDEVRLCRYRFGHLVSISDDGQTVWVTDRDGRLFLY